MREATATDRGGTWVAACAQLQARDLSEADQALEEALAAVDEAARAGADLVLLPECTYPGYFLADLPAHRHRLRPQQEVLEAFARQARDRRIHVAVGLALETGGVLRNSLVLFDRTGRLLCTAEKQFLWHFDSCWFAPGSASSPVDTEVGRLGLFICADGRLPELARSLALQGAGYLLDATAWVATGPTPQELRNAQADYMMEVRALENGVYLLAANKVGQEACAVRYCGKSLIVAPDGRVLARAAPDRPQIIYAELPRFHRPWVVDEQGASAAYLPRRRPELFAALAVEPRPVDGMEDGVPAVPVSHGAAPSPDADALFAAAVSVGWPAGAEVPESIEQRFAEVTRQVARVLRVAGWMQGRLVVLPDFAAAMDLGAIGPDHAESLASQLEETIRGEARRSSLAVVFGIPLRMGGSWYAGVTALEGDRVVARYRRAHLLRAEQGRYSQGEDRGPVVELAGTRVGLMGGPEGLLPEVSRLLSLDGAQLLAWTCGFHVPGFQKFVQTRAAENRVFVVAADLGDPWGGGQSLITGPGGAVLASTVKGSGCDTASAVLVLAEARVKLVVPGTDVIAGRRPRDYGALVRSMTVAGA